ncbi:hypothetical protein CHUAL_000012 [Chamberlinius hualienensis]
MYYCEFCLSLTIISVILWRLFDRWYRRDFIPDFNSKYVFITGTDTGFGHKLALDLDKLGLNVYAGCFTKYGANELKCKASKRLKTVEIDVTNQHSVDRAKEFIENDLQPGQELWGLVNNAGILGNIDFQLATLEDYKNVLEVNFFGQIRVTEAFLPLIKRSKGRIVQMSSMAGRGNINISPYTCSKWAIEPYADGVRRVVRSFGVSLSTIEPGSFSDTNILDETNWSGILKRKWESLSDQRKAELGFDYLDSTIKEIRYVFTNVPLMKWNRMEFVTDLMIHALGAQHPKMRYVVGYDARIYILLSNLTSDWFLDGFLRLRSSAIKAKIRKQA